jgi:hypothetical protein
MFLWNMLGALVLIPALSYFLLRHPVSQAHVAQAGATGTSQRQGMPHALTTSE